MEDMPDYEISEQKELEPCLNYIDEGIRKGGATLVVCTAGMSRSATICIAYLISRQKLSYFDAFAEVKAARRFIKPNSGFVSFLKKFEKKLRAEEVKQRMALNPKLKGDCELCCLEKKS